MYIVIKIPPNLLVTLQVILKTTDLYRFTLTNHKGPAL